MTMDHNVTESQSKSVSEIVVKMIEFSNVMAFLDDYKYNDFSTSRKEVFKALTEMLEEAVANNRFDGYKINPDVVVATKNLECSGEVKEVFDEENHSDSCDSCGYGFGYNCKCERQDDQSSSS